MLTFFNLKNSVCVCKPLLEVYFKVVYFVLGEAQHLSTMGNIAHGLYWGRFPVQMWLIKSLNLGLLNSELIKNWNFFPFCFIVLKEALLFIGIVLH